MERPEHIRAIEAGLRQFQVVAILGARQIGKTTLARQIAGRRSGATTVFDLEVPRDLERLADPMLALEFSRGAGGGPPLRPRRR